jgi:hypothetical protein
LLDPLLVWGANQTPQWSLYLLFLLGSLAVLSRQLLRQPHRRALRRALQGPDKLDARRRRLEGSPCEYSGRRATAASKATFVLSVAVCESNAFAGPALLRRTRCRRSPERACEKQLASFRKKGDGRFSRFPPQAHAACRVFVDLCSKRGRGGRGFILSHTRYPFFCCRFRSRTPGPPPFSSMNSTPAISNAWRTARSFALVSDVSLSRSSARRIVVTLRVVSLARSSALHRISARAALICELVNGFTAILTF